MEIDSKAPVFETYETFGRELILNDHYASPEIQEKLEEIREERDKLER